MDKVGIAVLGASGYTGAELVRMLVRHPAADIRLLTADRKAGQPMASVFPHLAPLKLPDLVAIEQIDWATAPVDVVFCALPHATTQLVLKEVLAKRPTLKVIDLSADFRLSDPAAYEKWYGHAHHATDLQAEAVYGLVEIYREDVRKARLVANPGCYTTTALLPVIPLLEARAVKPDPIIVDAKSGVSGAGRAAREAMLFTEVSEGFNTYGVGHHRHMAELDQEYSRAAGQPVVASFTPHLLPQNRGILATIYVQSTGGRSAADLHAILAARYAGEAFVHVTPFGELPATRHVRGSNMVMIGVAKDRQPGRAILVSVSDNLIKGASGQAIQNMNVVLGLDETLGLDRVALFP